MFIRMMTKLWCLLVLLTVGVSADKTVSEHGITTKVKGQSGKIAIYKGSNVTSGVTITFDALKEVTKDGTDEVVKFNTFANLDFSFSDLVKANYSNSDVEVTKFSFSAEIPHDQNKAKLTTWIYVFTSMGTIQMDGENITVKPGMMKFDVNIDGWVFCTNCTMKGKTMNGEYLDFTIEIKGKAAPKKESGDKPIGNYTLGDGASMMVPRKVLYDKKTTMDMPKGYPMLETKGGKSLFIFRFKRFTDSAMYDPLVDLNAGATPKPADMEKDVKEGDVSAKVKGKSGKIKLMKGQSSIDVEFDNLQEVKGDGNPIKDVKHRFNTFANQEFTFSDVTMDKYPGTQLDTQVISFEASLTNNANLQVYVFVFKSGGNITNGDEVVNVKKGSIKFNVEITDWRFCSATSTCQSNEVGEYLDFEIVMKGKSRAKKGKAAAKEGDKYEFGTADVWVSNKIIIDGGAPMDMTAGYPMLDSKGSKDIFKFRFKKFSARVVYDPTVQLNDAQTPANGSTVMTSSIFLVAVTYLLSIL